MTIALATRPQAPSRTLSSSRFQALSSEIRSEGLMSASRGLYYPLLFPAVVATYVGLFCAVWLFHPTLVAIGLGVLTALASGQVGLLGHDIGHRQAVRKKGNNYALRLLLGNVLLGVCESWWVDKHDRHHAHPNQVSRDPDVLSHMASTAKLTAGKRALIIVAIAIYVPLQAMKARYESVRFALREGWR
jgi:fatty acid desaturase